MTAAHDHDVVVVGAGLGGLACGVAAAKAGLSVLVLEAHDRVGGYASNFTRGPYRFEASLHLLDGVEPGGSNAVVWDALGLRERVPVVRPPLLRREIWPEHRFDVPQGREPWLALMARAFPHVADGFVALFDLAEAVHGAWLEDRDARIAGGTLSHLPGAMLPLLDRTARDVVVEQIGDDRAVAVATALACYLGLGPDELAAVPFLSMFASYHRHGGTFPVGGGQAVSDGLADALRAAGGEIRTHAPVVAIHTERGTVRGVTVGGNNGGRIDAEHVVCNVSPIRVYGELLDDARMAARFRRRLASLPLGTSVVKLWLGLTHDLADRSLAYELFVRGHYEHTFRAASLDDIGAVLPHRVDPGCCPEGHGILSMSIGVEADPAQTPREAGEALADAMIERVEATVPGLEGLRDCIAVRSVAVPSTFHAFTGNPGGTIHGFRPVPRQSGPRRFPLRAPLNGLFHVGGWTYGGSGYLPSMTSGLVVGRTIAAGVHA